MGTSASFDPALRGVRHNKGDDMAGIRGSLCSVHVLDDVAERRIPFSTIQLAGRALSSPSRSRSYGHGMPIASSSSICSVAI
jgi:hypothetical protein